MPCSFVCLCVCVSLSVSLSVCVISGDATTLVGLFDFCNCIRLDCILRVKQVHFHLLSLKIHSFPRSTFHELPSICMSQYWTGISCTLCVYVHVCMRNCIYEYMHACTFSIVFGRFVTQQRVIVAQFTVGFSCVDYLNAVSMVQCIL